MTGVPWGELKDWLTDNHVNFSVETDASLPVPYIDMRVPAVFGEDKKTRLYAQPGSEVGSGNTNIVPFTEVDVVRVAMDLGLDPRQLPSIGAGGQTMVDAVMKERNELKSVVQEDESYASVEDPSSEVLEEELRDQEEENELAEKIFEESNE